MTSRKQPTAHSEGFPWIFFLLVLLLSAPFMVAGPLVDHLLPAERAIPLPLTSLMVVAPMLSAVMLIGRRRGPAAIRRLFKRAIDVKGIEPNAWYAPTLLLMPAMMALQYVLTGRSWAASAAVEIQVTGLILSAVIYFIAAIGEEMGWMGYAYAPMENRFGALKASGILGIIWAIWHIVPMMQLDHSPTWKVWQSLNIVVVRALIVWLYNNSGKSVFIAVLFHTVYNLSTVTLPQLGWPYDPLAALMILSVFLLIIVVIWGPATLANPVEFRLTLGRRIRSK